MQYSKLLQRERVSDLFVLTFYPCHYLGFVVSLRVPIISPLYFTKSSDNIRPKWYQRFQLPGTLQSAKQKVKVSFYHQQLVLLSSSPIYIKGYFSPAIISEEVFDFNYINMTWMAFLLRQFLNCLNSIKILRM